VAMSAVVGIPDPVRTESIKAWIVLRPGFWGDDALAREIQDFVKVQLAAHEYPRYVQFTDVLPMTATGKVLRRELRALG
jgi:acetyl-CoA synthetase